MSRGTSYSCRLCQSVIFLSILLPLFVYCQGEVSTANNCNKNCTGQATSYVCASNGVTYDNICEMEKAACLDHRELRAVEHAQCNSPFKNSETCHQHQTRILDEMLRGSTDYMERCNATVLLEKSNAGTMTLFDVVQCYRPDCGIDSYAPKQCLNLGNYWDPERWCWCSGPQGHSIPNTLSRNMQPNECVLRESCQYEGSTYADGEPFKPQHKCGVCECLNGNVTCFDDFVPDMEGELTTSQLNQLIDLLKKFFYFEKDRKDSIIYNIRDVIAKTSPNDTQTPYYERKVLNEWFQHYDSDGNGCIELNHTEEITFHDHIHIFTSCAQFLDHISEVIDVDDSGSITHTEWMTFFTNGVSEEPGTVVPNASKRSVGSRPSALRKRRSLQNRNKFLYVLL